MIAFLILYAKIIFIFQMPNSLVTKISQGNEKITYPSNKAANA